MAGDVMEPDPVSVEIIENCQAEFIPFSVVRLGPLGTKTNSGWGVGMEI